MLSLSSLLKRLKLAIQARDWKEIMRALGQLLVGGSDLAEMFDGGAKTAASAAIGTEEVTAELKELEGMLQTLQAETANAAASADANAVDPVKLVALLKLVLDMVAEWRKRS